jgi:hypothetical protein
MKLPASIMVSLALMVLAASAAAAALPILVSPWPPVDPDQETTTVEFSAAWAQKLRGFQSLSELQRAAGSQGKITERDKGQGNQFAVFQWISKPPNGRGGYMIAHEYSDGSIGLGVMTSDVGEIIINTFGAFMCDKCKPPIEVGGARPSWASSSVPNR